MRSRRPALFLVVALSAASALSALSTPPISKFAAAKPSPNPSRPNPKATEWLASPAEAARIARVESGLAPAALPGDAPVKMSLAEWMAFFKIPGLSVAVFDNHQIVWARTYGVKESGKPDPVTLDTLFQAASISKPVAALAALKQVEAGKLALDENVNDRLRSWKLPENELTKNQPVTLRRLLSHSAGTTVHGFPGYAPNQPLPTVPQILDGAKPANTAPVRVDLAPGTKSRYSGGGITIMQLLLTDVLGKPFPEIMRESVIAPLGLAHSTFEQPLPAARAATAATAHHASGKPVEGRWHLYPEMAAAGLWTTPRDLAAIAIEVAKSKAGKSNRVLSPKMTTEMLTVQAEPVGLGFFLRKGSDQFGHNGSNEGFNSLLIASAGSGSGVAIMANSDRGWLLFDRIAASVAREYGWRDYRPENDNEIGVAVAVTAQRLGLPRAIELYRKARAQSPKEKFSANDLNNLGYQLMGEGRLADAVTVFEANVEMYPDNWNVIDSLAEGYMNAGKREAAITNYKRSLELNPGNDNGVRMLEKMGVKWSKPK